ncbi:hypothetical protein ES288_D10G056400v1, partial [Gossypium darwinii]
IRDYVIPYAKGLRTTNQFSGFSHENPNQHLQKFIKLCNTFKLNGVFTEVVKLSSYTGFRESIKGDLDAIANGALLSKSPKEAAKIIVDMTENNSDDHHSWQCITEAELVGFVGNPGRQQNNPFSNMYNSG